MTYIPVINSRELAEFSSDTIVPANGTFPPLPVSGVDVLMFNSVLVTIEADADSAAGGVSIQFSADNTNWSVCVAYTYTTFSTRFQKMHAIPSKYMRIIYTNSNATQTFFRMQTIVSTTPRSSDTSQTVRLAATQIDAFHRIRVSNPETLISASNNLGVLNTVECTTLTLGTGTVGLLSNSPMVACTTTAVGDRVVYQSRARAIYEPGKSQLCFITGILNPSLANGDGVVSRLGFFDDDNGFYFEVSSTVPPTQETAIVLRSSVGGGVTTNRVTQENWNGDKLDGTGTSGITLNVDTTVIYVINYQWLGVGQVRMGVVIGPDMIIAHTFSHSNIDLAPFSFTGALPARGEITATGANSAGSVNVNCFSAMSEGGFQPRGRHFSYGYQVFRTIVLSDTYYPLAVLMPKDPTPATGYAPYASHIQVKLKGARVMLRSNANVEVQVRLYRDTVFSSIVVPTNPLLPISPVQPYHTSNAVVMLPATNSPMALVSPTLGTPPYAWTNIYTGYITASTDIVSLGEGAVNVTATVNASGISDFFLLCARLVNGTNQDTIGSLDWEEV